MKAISYIVAFLIALFYIQIVIDGYKEKHKTRPEITVVVTVLSAKWCPACKVYAPEVEKFAKSAGPNVLVVLKDADREEVVGSPGYIPWTLIQGQNTAECRAEITGAATAEALAERVLAVMECEQDALN